MTYKLNTEEKELLASYDNDEWVSIADAEESEQYKSAAKNTKLKIPSLQGMLSFYCSRSVK